MSGFSKDQLLANIILSIMSDNIDCILSVRPKLNIVGRV